MWKSEEDKLLLHFFGFDEAIDLLTISIASDFVVLCLGSRLLDTNVFDLRSIFGLCCTFFLFQMLFESKSDIFLMSIFTGVVVESNKASVETFVGCCFLSATYA